MFATLTGNFIGNQSHCIAVERNGICQVHCQSDSCKWFDNCVYPKRMLCKCHLGSAEVMVIKGWKTEMVFDVSLPGLGMAICCILVQKMVFLFRQQCSSWQILL